MDRLRAVSLQVFLDRFVENFLHVAVLVRRVHLDSPTERLLQADTDVGV